MLIEILIITIASIIILIYIFLIWNFNYWKNRGVIGPKPKILFGTVPSIITQAQSQYCDIDEIYQNYKNIDRFVGIFLIQKPSLLILDSNLVHEIFTTNYKYFSKNDASFIDPNIDNIFSRNPFVLTGSKWKEQRSQVTPALTALRIKSLYPVMLTICNRLTKYIENEIKTQTKVIFNGRRLAARFTIENVANFIYGFDAGAFVSENEKCEILEMSYGLLDSSILSQMYIFISQAIPKLRLIYSRPTVPKRNENYLLGLLQHAIKLRRQNPNNRTDFLNYLLQLQEKKNLSDEDLTAHTMTFYFDGFETSSVAISNCLYLLAKHQDIQTNLRQQIRQIFPKLSSDKEDNSFDEDDVKNFEKILELKYLDNIINETLRLLPPAGWLSKVCTESCKLKNVKGELIEIEKDIVLRIPIASIQRDENNFRNAKEFIPERFNEYDDAAKKFREMGIYLPFGDGPRVCLGQKFALAQIKAAIFEFVRNWKISLNEKTMKNFEPDPKTFFYTVKGEIWLEFERVF